MSPDLVCPPPPSFSLILLYVSQPKVGKVLTVRSSDTDVDLPIVAADLFTILKKQNNRFISSKWLTQKGHNHFVQIGLFGRDKIASSLQNGLSRNNTIASSLQKGLLRSNTFVNGVRSGYVYGTLGRVKSNY